MILFKFHTDNIKVQIDAYFEDGKLVVDGYDIGKAVEEFWGDSDYEYTTTVFPLDVKKLYPLFNISEDPDILLQQLAARFNTNSCYSDFRNFCDANGIQYESFSWT